MATHEPMSKARFRRLMASAETTVDRAPAVDPEVLAVMLEFHEDMAAAYWRAARGLQEVGVTDPIGSLPRDIRFRFDGSNP